MQRRMAVFKGYESIRGRLGPSRPSRRREPNPGRFNYPLAQVPLRMESIKEAIIRLLVPLFGEGMRSPINRLYGEDDPQEMIDLAHHMLAELWGRKNAERALQSVIARFPELRLPA